MKEDTFEAGEQVIVTYTVKLYANCKMEDILFGALLILSYETN